MFFFNIILVWQRDSTRNVNAWTKNQVTNSSENLHWIDKLYWLPNNMWKKNTNKCILITTILKKDFTRIYGYKGKFY